MLLATALTFPLPQASTMAPKTDLLYNFIYWFSVVSLAFTTAAMLWFAWKYREGHNKNPIPVIEGHPAFEWTVSIVLSFFFVAIFIWGLIGFNEIYDTPRGAYEINVIGQQWMWTFQYANGQSSTNVLYVPRGRPVKLIMTSKDVIHDLFIPNFRLKQDVVPGMYTTLWFEAPNAGENQIFCAQYCGTAHSNMIGKVVVMEPDEFNMWLNGIDPQKMKPLELGKHLFTQRNCIACHATGTGAHASHAGPALNGIFGKSVKFTDGTTAEADENYIRESIVNPAGKIVEGFSPIMPTYKGLLTEEEINYLVAYIKSLKE
jgi:cytochrome c oxidase subunit II